MSAAKEALGQEVGEEEACALFDGLKGLRGLVLAVSGGPDSTALLVLAARWAKRLQKEGKRAPKLLAVTVDHGLRAQSAHEAEAVKHLAGRLGVAHRTLRWGGKKPQTGLQDAARKARYRLLAQAAKRAGYLHILTGHTLDDQAETVLFRLARGSGLTGLAGMARISPCLYRREGRGEAAPSRQLDRGPYHLPSLRPADVSATGRGKAKHAQQQIVIVRPFLAVSKVRLVATLKAAGIGYGEDPTNRDPRFARARIRTLMPALAREGLDARALARLSARMRRAEAAIEFAVDAARAALAPGQWPRLGPIGFATAAFSRLPAEVALRLLGRAVAQAGDEGPVELGKLEALYAALRQAPLPLRRTLAGALITLTADRLTVERAPARRKRVIAAPATAALRK